MTSVFSTHKGVTINCKSLLDGWDGICPLCRKNVPTDELQIAHDVDPRRGGPHTVENCLLLCKWCHRRKGWLTMEQIRAEQVAYQGAEHTVPCGAGYVPSGTSVTTLGKWLDCNDGFQIWQIG